MVYCNPEVEFWNLCIENKQRELEKVRASAGMRPIILIGGGSSCAFSIHPDQISKEVGLPAYNLGGSVLMGLKYTTAMLLSAAKSGDIVVLHYEPELFQWCKPRNTPTGIRLALRQGDLGWAFGKPVFDEAINWVDVASAVRPGSRYLFAYGVKTVSGHPMYRYSVDGLRDYGLVEYTGNERNKERAGVVRTSEFLTDEALQCLTEIQNYCSEKDITLLYVLPWKSTDPSFLETARAENKKYLKIITSVVQPIEEEQLGVVDDNDMFSDTLYHLTFEAGAKRSAILGQNILAAIKKSHETAGPVQSRD